MDTVPDNLFQDTIELNPALEKEVIGRDQILDVENSARTPPS
jgi:hypothetical protein